MRRILFLFFMSVLIVSCGDLAPVDSVVIGPADATNALPLSTTASSVIYGPLQFSVEGPNEEPRPSVEIDFFAGGTAFLTTLDGTPLSDSFNLKVKTDERGVAQDIYVVVVVAGCTTGSTVAVVAGGTVLATVGSASNLWTATITRSCGAVTGS